MCVWYLKISKEGIGPNRPGVMGVSKFLYGDGEKAQCFKDLVFQRTQV